jgi:hypothetical protein
VGPWYENQNVFGWLKYKHAQLIGPRLMQVNQLGLGHHAFYALSAKIQL